MISAQRAQSPALRTGLVVYDLDGTLVDSAGHIRHTVNRVRAELGLRDLTLEDVRPCIGDGARSLVARTLFGRELLSGAPGYDVATGRSFPEVFALFMERYLEDPSSGVTVMDGVFETLEALHRAGVAQAVLTNKPHDVTQPVIDGLGLRRFTPLALGPGAMLPGLDGELPPKPDPTGLRWLLQRYGVAPAEALMVGDGSQDARVAANAGVPAWLIGQSGVRSFPSFTELGEALRGRIAQESGG